MEPTIDSIAKMMKYMRKDSYIVPHYNLPLPFEADGENYRPEKVFRIFRNGTLEYRGWGLAYSRMNPTTGKLDITISGIPASPRWITRAYIHISDEVRSYVLAKILPLKIKKLILKFNNIDFILLH